MDIKEKVFKLYNKGISVEDIAEQLDMDVSEVEDIIDKGEEKEEEPAQKKGRGKKDVEEQMESIAESTSVKKVVERTKAEALAIQKTKEAIGDYVYSLFENSGIPTEQMIDFAYTAINFFVENYKQIEELEAQLDAAEEIISRLYEVASQRAEVERVVNNYVMKCAAEGTPVDADFVKKLLGYTTEETVED